MKESNSAAMQAMPKQTKDYDDYDEDSDDDLLKQACAMAAAKRK